MYANFCNCGAKHSRFWDYPSSVSRAGSQQLVGCSWLTSPHPRQPETLEVPSELLETVQEAKDALGSGRGVETRRPGGGGSPGRCSARWRAPPVSCLHEVGCNSPLFILCSLSSEKQVQASALTERVLSAPPSFCPISKYFTRKVEFCFFFLPTFTDLCTPGPQKDLRMFSP